MVEAQPGNKKVVGVSEEGWLEQFGLWLAEWSEKWFPDALVFALVGIVIVFCFGLFIGERPMKLAIEGGGNPSGSWFHLRCRWP